VHCVVCRVSEVQGEGKVPIQRSYVDFGLQWECQWKNERSKWRCLVMAVIHCDVC
jgi:hypothetical protein